MTDIKHTDSVEAVAERVARDFCRKTPRVRKESGVEFYERLNATIFNALTTLQAHTSQQVEEAANKRREWEALVKETHSMATKRGYALAIKHIEERCLAGEPLFETIESMKRLHAKSFITPNHQD